MPKVPDISEVSLAIDYDIGAAREYAGDLLEDVNDQWAAHALWSMNLEDVELACEFLHLEASVMESGELTPELREKSNELLDRFKEAQERADEEEEGEDEV